jgi:hypothetical protein
MITSQAMPAPLPGLNGVSKITQTIISRDFADPLGDDPGAQGAHAVVFASVQSNQVCRI